MLRHLILGLLRHLGARHGYSLMKEYRDASGREINVGNFYREFQRLQVEGLVHRVDTPTGTDARRVPYEITDLGLAEFDEWLKRSSPSVAVDYESEHSLRALLAVQATHPLVSHVLANWFDELTDQQRLVQAAREQALHACRAARASTATATLPLWLERRLNHLAIDLEFIEALRTACTPRGCAVGGPGASGRRFRAG